jgi:hypothetical protein
MASAFGRGPYGAGIYSRDPVRIEVASSSSVGARPRVQHMVLIRVNSSSSVTTTGRLLWTTIVVEPCEGKWAPLVNNPCRRAA